MTIHSSAIIDKECRIGEGVHIGANSYIGAKTQIGDNTVIHAQVVIDGNVTIGENNIIFPGAVIGFAPQDKTYKGEESGVLIGNNNVLREYVTINAATGAGALTQIGNDNMIMAYCHVAHNCRLGNDVTMANSVSLGGHVVVESYAILGGVLGVHQFTHIGQLSMIGGMSRVDRDVPPFTLVEGNPARIRGLNKIGLQRNGHLGSSSSDIWMGLKEVFKTLYSDRTNLNQRVSELLGTLAEDSPEQALVSFLDQSLNDTNRRGPVPRQANEDSSQNNDLNKV